MNQNPRSALATAAAAAVLLGGPLAAQRGTPSIEHQKLVCALDHGIVPWGRHSLAELAVGQNGRLGMNEASAWRTQLPIVQGEALIAPGGYRVTLQRPGANEFGLVLDSAGLALGRQESGELACALADGKEAKKLEIELRAAKPKAGGAAGGATAGASPHLDAHLQARFGPHQLDAEFTLVGGRELLSTARFRLVGWYLPVAVVERQLERGAGVPIATLFPKKPGRGDPELFNVVVTKDGARVVPGMRMPTESYGFGAVEPPAAAATETGRVEWKDAAQRSEQIAFGSSRADRAEKGLVVELQVGTRSARVVAPEPKADKS